MIRMGRNSKEQPMQPDAPQTANQPSGYSYQQHQTDAPQFRMTGDNSASTGRAITESESMARDIKEGRLSGFVGSGTMLTGETSFKAMLRVDGHLTGKVSSEGGTLMVGASGQVDANIAVAAAVINGSVNGDIVASERIELGRTAKVVGNIQTPLLTMEQGAILEGGCSMIKQRAETEKNFEPQIQSDNYQYETHSTKIKSYSDDAAETHDSENEIATAAQ